ncbi:MAG TPA: type II toxin-antitoxin system HicB family antitoxin [Candidatus Paceibacterota bacterium]
MYTAVYEKVPQGYIAWLEEIPGVLTQGKTKKEAQENLKDAFKLFMPAATCRDARRNPW